MVSFFTQVADGFAYPFSPDIFFTVRGCENVHIYLWILKDLSWCMNFVVPGMFFGLCALLWMGVLLYHAIKYKNNEEKYFVVATFIWLLANYVWMSGNLLYNSDKYRFTATCLMMVSIIMILYYFFFLKNKEFFTPNDAITKIYNDNGLIPRFHFFNTWRRYELVHVLFLGVAGQINVDGRSYSDIICFNRFHHSVNAK